jgi:hypothetical protein
MPPPLFPQVYDNHAFARKVNLPIQLPHHPQYKITDVAYLIAKGQRIKVTEYGLGVINHIAEPDSNNCCARVCIVFNHSGVQREYRWYYIPTKLVWKDRRISGATLVEDDNT